MFSIRARTLSGSSSFLIRSLGLSGSRWPSAHWPSPRGRRGAGRRARRGSGRAGVLLTAIVGVLRCLLCLSARDAAAGPAKARRHRCLETAGAVRARDRMVGRRQ